VKLKVWSVRKTTQLAVCRWMTDVARTVPDTKETHQFVLERHGIVSRIGTYRIWNGLAPGCASNAADAIPSANPTTPPKTPFRICHAVENVRLVPSQKEIQPPQEERHERTSHPDHGGNACTNRPHRLAAWPITTGGSRTTRNPGGG
jgi:hypothetical protein